MLENIRRTLDVDDSVSDERLLAHIGYAIYIASEMIKVRRHDLDEENGTLNIYYKGELNAYEDIISMMKP